MQVQGLEKRFRLWHKLTVPEIVKGRSFTRSDHSERAQFTREELVYDKQRLLTPVKELEGPICFAKEKFNKWRTTSS